MGRCPLKLEFLPPGELSESKQKSQHGNKKNNGRDTQRG